MLVMRCFLSSLREKYSNCFSRTRLKLSLLGMMLSPGVQEKSSTRLSWDWRITWKETTSTRTLVVRLWWKEIEAHASIVARNWQPLRLLSTTFYPGHKVASPPSSTVWYVVRYVTTLRLTERQSKRIWNCSESPRTPPFLPITMWQIHRNIGTGTGTTFYRGKIEGDNRNIIPLFLGQ